MTKATTTTMRDDGDDPPDGPPASAAQDVVHLLVIGAQPRGSRRATSVWTPTRSRRLTRRCATRPTA